MAGALLPPRTTKTCPDASLIRPAAVAGCCANAGPANTVRAHTQIQRRAFIMTTSSYQECTEAPTTSRRGALLSTLDALPVQAQDRIYAIITLRGCCELSSRKVFLFSNASAVGCTAPVTSVTRETSVCSPGVAPVHV